jgi:hypothetical protein
MVFLVFRRRRVMGLALQAAHGTSVLGEGTAVALLIAAAAIAGSISDTFITASPME